MPEKAKPYIYIVSGLGALAAGSAFWNPSWPHDALRLSVYLVLSLVTATLKLRLPGLTGTMSIGFVFVLLGISDLTLAETLLMACTGVVVQCLWRPQQPPRAIQVIFSMAAVAISAALAYACVDLVRQRWHTDSVPVLMALATCLYFLANSLLVSGVLSQVYSQPLPAVWQQCYLISFPYYMAGGAVAGLMAASSRAMGWQRPLLILPVMGLAFLCYRIFLERQQRSERALSSPAETSSV